MYIFLLRVDIPAKYLLKIRVCANAYCRPHFTTVFLCVTAIEGGLN